MAWTHGTCSGCVFGGAESDGSWLCRASVPAAAPSGKALWPKVDAIDWCGEWRDTLARSSPSGHLENG